MSPDPYLSEERKAERAEHAQRWVDFIKAGMRGEVDLLADIPGAEDPPKTTPYLRGNAV